MRARSGSSRSKFLVGLEIELWRAPASRRQSNLQTAALLPKNRSDPFLGAKSSPEEPHPFPGECYTICSCWMTIFACESRMIDDATRKLAYSNDGGGESRRRRSAAPRDPKSIFVWAPISNRPGMHRTLKRSCLHRRYLSTTYANYPLLIYSPHPPCDAHT
jgi:hypothetical protein